MTTRMKPGECAECEHYFLSLANHQTRGHGRTGVLVRRERTPDCRLCSEGRHHLCVGIACHCTATPRCETNAALVAEREIA